VHGQSVEKFSFANSSIPSTQIVCQYDQSTKFIVRGEECSARQLGPTMPISWLWLKFAKFVGTQMIDEVEYNCWAEEVRELLAALACANLRCSSAAPLRPRSLCATLPCPSPAT
jgi:hypothetical protein